MNERAGWAGPQRAPPSGLCGGRGAPTRAAAWTPRVRRACVRTGARRARAQSACVPARGGPAHCACVRPPRGRVARGLARGRLSAAFVRRACRWGARRGSTPLGGGGGCWALLLTRALSGEPGRAFLGMQAPGLFPGWPGPGAVCFPSAAPCPPVGSFRGCRLFPQAGRRDYPWPGGGAGHPGHPWGNKETLGGLQAAGLPPAVCLFLTGGGCFCY